MVTRGRTVTRPVVRAQRRLTAWDDENVGFDIASGTEGNLELAQNVADPEKRGCTAIRILVNVWLHASTPGAVSGSQILSIGIALTSDDAFAGSVLPDAEVAADFPVSGWLYRERFMVTDELLSSGVIQPIHVNRDLHASRKLDRATLFIQFANGAIEGSTFNVRAVGLVRVLYKLP